MRQLSYALSDAATRRWTSPARAIADAARQAYRRLRTAASPVSASPCRSSCGTGPKMSARRARPWTAGVTATSAPKCRRDGLPGLSAERRVLRLRGGAGVRQDRRAARFHLFLHRRVRRRRRRAQRQASRRADRQCGRAWLDAGAGTGRHSRFSSSTSPRWPCSNGR